MSEISDLLKRKYQDRIAGELESCTIPELDGLKIYWKPLTGSQQKQIQKFAEKSTSEGICMHIKTRALDEKGGAVFGDDALIGMMSDFDFEVLSRIFAAMTGLNLSTDDIEKN